MWWRLHALGAVATGVCVSAAFGLHWRWSVTKQSRRSLAALIVLLSLSHWVSWRSVRPYSTVGQPAEPRGDAVEIAGVGIVPRASVDLGVALRPGDRITRRDDADDELVCWEISRMSGDAMVLLGIPIDLNEDDAPALAALPGIGPVTAREIVAHRPYRRESDVMGVRGVGRVTWAGIRDRVVAARARARPEPPCRFVPQR